VGPSSASEENLAINIETDAPTEPLDKYIASLAAVDAQLKETDRELQKVERQAVLTGNSLEYEAAKSRAAQMSFANEAEKRTYVKNAYAQLTKESAKGRAEQKKAQQELEKTTLKVKLFGQELITLKKKSLQDGKKGLDAFLKGLRDVESVVRLTAGSVTLLSVGMGATGLVAGALNAVPALSAVVVQLGSMLSFSALLPTTIGALVGSMMTLKLATSGVSDAISAAWSRNFIQFAQAVNQLSPSAAKFAQTLSSWMPQFRNLRTTIQERFFAVFTGDINGFLTSTLPRLGAGMSGLATSLGGVFQALMQWLESPKGGQLLDRIFLSGQQFAQAVSAHLRPLLDGLSTLMQHVAPIWTRLMQDVGSGMDKFGAWLTRISQDGTLDKWLTMATNAAKSLGDIFEGLWGILKAFALVAGGQALARGAMFLQKWADFLNTAQGQSELSAFFDEMKRVTDALEPALPIVGHLIVLLAQAIADIVIGAAPGFIAFLQALSDAFASMSQNDPQFWVKFGTALGGVLTDLAGFLPTIFSVLQAIISFLSDKTRLEMILVVVGVIWAVITAVEVLEPLLAGAAGLAAALGLGLGEVLAIIAAVIAVIAVLAIAIIFLITHWHDLGRYAKEALDGIAAGIGWIAGEGWKGLKMVGDGIQWLVDHPLAALRDIWNAITDGISTAYHAVKDFVSSLDPSSWPGAAAKFFQGIAGSFMSGFNAGSRFTGGDVTGGQTYTVNELGPEKFLSAGGQLTDIGNGTMGSWVAPSSGVVIPAHLTAAFDRVAALAGARMGRDGDDLEPTLAKAFHRTAGDTVIDNSQYHVHATVNHPTSDVDVERAVLSTLKRVEQDRKERR
jgi:hypothetical protein